MYLKENVILIFLGLMTSALGICQDTVTLKDVTSPNITHFSRSDFESDAQFWDMTADSNGVLYFGNNDGIVIYDGEHWSKLTLPNSSSVRSLCTATNGKIYAGGFNELGTVEQDLTGKYTYRSLTKALKLDNENLENLWQAHTLDDYVIYRTFSGLLVLKANTVTHINTNTRFVHSEIVNERLLVQEMDRGVMQFDPKTNRLNLLFKYSDFNGEELISFLPYGDNDTVLLVAKSGRLYKANLKSRKVSLWKSVFDAAKEDQVITAVMLRGEVFMGTLSSKIIILDKEGKIRKNVAEFANLSDTTVLNLYEHHGNLWALLNNGLDFIGYTSPVSNLFHKASIYEMLLQEDGLYLATNKGVYFTSSFLNDEKTPDFSRIAGLEGQAWSVQVVDGEVLIGHDRGLFVLKEGKPFQIGNQNGFWKVTPIPNKPHSYLASSYHGLYLLQKQEENWQISSKIEGFNESTRDIGLAKETNTFWVCHGYKGVYKIRFNEAYSRVYAIDHFTDQNGFASPFNINVRRYKDTTLFTSNTGIYTFNYENKIFEPYKPLNRILDSTLNTRTIFANAERTWVVQDDEVAYFDSESPENLHKNLFLNLRGYLNKGMESFLPLDKDHILIGAKTGLYLYNTKKPQVEKTILTLITEASFLKGEETTPLPLYGDKEIDIPNNTDILRITFAAPEMAATAPVQYSYKLDGIDQAWSQWSTRPRKEFTHLPPGSYTFLVKSRNLMGETGTVTHLSFCVPALWYQTHLAIAIYILIFIFGILLAYILVQKKIILERRKAQVETYKTKKLLELEIEQLTLKQDKVRIKKDKQLLEEDNIEKSKELANYTMLLVKKKDIFSDTYANLKEFKNTLNTQPAKKRLSEVLFKLNQHRIGEEYMNIFDVNFEKVHKNFFKELKIIVPNLSKRELRLCAFVKMNLSNKEIAPLLNISVRGVETARYRLRKKLNVQETHFNEFLQDLNLHPEAS